MTVSGCLYALPTLAHPIEGSAGFAWPTPTASDGQDRKPSKTPHLTKSGTYRHRAENGETSFMRLPQVVELWAAPTGDDADNVTRKSRISNPEFVEMLMGLPIGWTDLDGPPRPDTRSTTTSRRVSYRIVQTEPPASRRSAMRLCLNAPTRCSSRYVHSWRAQRKRQRAAGETVASTIEEE